MSIAASALMQALAPKPKKQGSGISTRVTKTGGLNPASFILGKYATAGTYVCPPMSYTISGGSPLGYLTYVIELGDIPGQTLDRVMINDEYVTFAASPGTFDEPVLGRYLNYAWVRYYDGTQTVADPKMLIDYGSYPIRPWTSDMIGRGMCYAIVTFLHNPEIWQGFPRVRFEMGGIPLYDIRKDSTAGGSGTHRWATPSTWQQTTNPMVMIYNIMRGISLQDGSVWGGRVAAADLIPASWMAAMNECDVASPATGGGTEAQFRAGFEVTLDQEPADVIAELLKACSGQIVEVGGRWKVRAGGPGLPVYYFTDADIVISQPQDLKPFPGLDASYNGIHASYPEPASLWESKDAPPRYNATYEAEDQSRRRVADLALPAVPYPAQVQRLMVAYIKEERRFRRHGLTLPADAAILEPLDAVNWTSTTNGYASKVFEVSEVTDDLRNCLQRVALRERDPTDYSYPIDILLPSAPGVPGVNVPAAQSVPGWNLTGVNLTDAAATARRPALLLAWDGSNQADVRAIRVEVRLTATGAIVHRGSYHDVSVGQAILSAGILPNTSYQARGRFVVDRATAWTAWDTAISPNIGITNADFVGGIGGFLNGAQASWGEVVSSLPLTGNWFGRQVILASNGKNYSWTGTAWVTGVDAADIIGTLTTANFATSLRPPEVVAVLPATGNYLGRMVFLTTDEKLYKHSGSPAGSAGFKKDVDGADLIANSIIAGKFAAGAIAADDLAANSFVASKALISDSTNVYPDYDMDDPAYYSTLNAAAYSFGELVGDTLGANSLLLPASAALQSVVSKWTVIEPNADYAVSIAAWLTSAAAGAGQVLAYIQLGSLGAGRVVTATRSVLIVSRTDSTSLARAVVNILTAANERRCRILFQRVAGGTAPSRHSGPRIMRRGNASLLVDGIFAVTGMAAFGGDLQSTGYNPGVSGWRIRDTGVAEFANLVVRSWLVDGSVTDQFQTIALGPFGFSVADVEVARVTLGAVPRGNIYLRGLACELATLGAAPNQTQVLVKLQTRYKQLGGAFTAWLTIQTFTSGSAGGVWDVFNDSGNLSGYYDDFEYRIVYRNTQDSGSSPASGNCLRNVYLTVTRTTK